MLSQNNNINAHKCCHKKTPKINALDMKSFPTN